MVMPVAYECVRSSGLKHQYLIVVEGGLLIRENY